MRCTSCGSPLDGVHYSFCVTQQFPPFRIAYGGIMPEEKKAPPPAAERRGGDKPDWQAVQPGEELPEFPDAAPPVVIQSEYEPEG